MSPTRPGPHSGVSTAQLTQSIQPCWKLDTTVRKSKLRLSVYTGNGLTIREIEEHWLSVLELPRDIYGAIQEYGGFNEPLWLA